MKKKSQVTIFIIIALVIVITFSLLFLLRAKLTPSVKQKYTEAPTSIKPIQEFVEHSIQQSLIEATVSLGEHCGIVDPNSYKVSGNLDDPTESIVLKPFYFSKRVCPYWYFMSSRNSCDSDCKFSSLMPNIKSKYLDGNQRNYTDFSLEAQIDRHIKANLMNLNFRDFSFQDYDIKQKGDIDVTTTIGKDIRVQVTYPLIIRRNGKEYNLNQFYVELPFDLNKVYRIAAKITSEEKNKRFLENFARSLISVYSGLDKNKLPPITREIDFTNSPVFWQITDVKNQLRQKVLDKISAITVYGSKNYNNQTPVSGAVLNFPGEDLSDIEVYFTFPDTRPFYLALNGMKDGAIGPSTSITNLLFYQFKVNDYWIAYDLSFPVLVTLKVPSKEGSYQFQFALEANLRNNVPLWENTTATSLSNAQTMFCDKLQRISGETTISTRDYYGNHVGNVDIYFKCGNSGCYIGTTDDNGLLKTKLPSCVNGVLVANKQDYIGKYKQFTSMKNKKASIKLEVSKLKEFTLDARKLIFTKEDTPLGFRWGYKALSNYQPKIDSLTNNENLIVTFKRIDSDADDYEISAEIKGDSMQLSKTKLLPGKYEVTAQLIKNAKLVVPGSNGLLGIGKTNDTEINVSQCGGVILNKKTSYFDLTKNKFESSKSITIYTTYFDFYSLTKDQLKPTDLVVNNDIEMLSQKYRENLEPQVR